MNNKNKIIGISLVGLMMALPITGVLANGNVDSKKDTAVETKGYTKDQVADARFALQEARLKLSSDYKSLLKEEISKENIIRESKNYVAADSKVSADYEKELYNAKKLLKDEKIDKEKLETALNSLRDAEKKLISNYKTALLNEVKFAKTFMKSDIYKNAEIEKSTNYNTALGIAKSTLKDGEATEEDYKTDLLNLLDERYSMDTTLNFKEDLSKEVEKESEVLKSEAFKKAPIEFQSDYVNSIKEAKELLENKKANSKDFDAALFNIKDAKRFLGISENALLKEEVKLSDEVKSSKEYENATKMDKSNYEKALKDAREVLR